MTRKKCISQLIRGCFHSLYESFIGKKQSAKWQSLKITGIYLLIGFAWIILTDKVVDIFIPDRSEFLIINIFKGLVYVSATSILIYILVFSAIKRAIDSRGQFEKMNSQLEEKNSMLDNSNTLLLAIMESSPQVIIFALDINYCYLAFNKKHKDTIEQIWGKEISIGTNMLDVIGMKEDRDKAKANFDRALAGESFTLTEEYGDEMLSRLFWQNFYSPILSKEGEIIGLPALY